MIFGKKTKEERISKLTKEAKEIGEEIEITQAEVRVSKLKQGLRDLKAKRPSKVKEGIKRVGAGLKLVGKGLSNVAKNVDDSNVYGQKTKKKKHNNMRLF